MKVLLAVDESSFSERAVEHVRASHCPPGTEITVLSVAEPPRGATADAWGGPMPYLEEILKAEREFREGLVQRMAQRLAGSPWEVKTAVAQGDARSAIVEHAERLAADLVVVGSHGRSGLARLLMGSVANYVVAHSPCNVLVVKAPRP